MRRQFSDVLQRNSLINQERERHGIQEIGEDSKGIRLRTVSGPREQLVQIGAGWL